MWFKPKMTLMTGNSNDLTRMTGHESSAFEEEDTCGSSMMMETDMTLTLMPWRRRIHVVQV